MSNIIRDNNLQYNGPYANWINQYSRQEGLDPFMIAGMIKQESGFNKLAHSTDGGMGLAQFTDGTYNDVNKEYGLPNPYDPQQAIRCMCLFFRDTCLKYAKNNEARAIGRYNGDTYSNTYYNNVVAQMNYCINHYSKSTSSSTATTPAPMPNKFSNTPIPTPKASSLPIPTAIVKNTNKGTAPSVPASMPTPTPVKGIAMGFGIIGVIVLTYLYHGNADITGI